MKPSILYQFLEWDCKLHRVFYFVLIAECSAKNKVKHVSFLPNIHSSVLIHESQIYSIFLFSVIEQLGGKQMVMQYLSHEDPNVRFEALIAVQKLMVHNWWVKARNSHLHYTCVVEVELLAWHFYKETDYLSVLYYLISEAIFTECDLVDFQGIPRETVTVGPTQGQPWPGTDCGVGTRAV